MSQQGLARGRAEIEALIDAELFALSGEAQCESSYHYDYTASLVK